MSGSLVRRAIAFIILFSHSPSAAVVFGQQKTEETRPRRTQPVANQTITSAPNDDAWKTPSTETPVSLRQSTTELIAGPEPTIRVALATDVRSATVSTTGRLMNASDSGTHLIALDVARVRLEPRLLSPLPPVGVENSYRLAIGGAVSRAEAEQKSREVREAIGEDSQITVDAETKTWGLVVGNRLTRAEAEELNARLNDAGFDARVFQSGLAASSQSSAIATQSHGTDPSQARSSAGNLRLATRVSAPSREVVGFSGAARSFSSSAPVVLASDDEAKAPVRFNERPYRGRIEVFTNTRGSLTVVNVLGLEDYVRGVVANELSPGGYPALEALKAQAIAARTYALRNRGQFVAQGFDLLPTTRSQVYRGLRSEHALSTRAVDETRGLIATYNGEPINALYTSTCGGRTEDAGNIFNHAVPYLRGHECSAEGPAAFAPFMIKTTREPPELREEKNLPLARDAALLNIHSFGALPSQLSDDWLTSPAPVAEVRHWLASVARVSRQTAPVVTDDVNRPAAFATALNAAVFGESRADTLFNNADVEYLLPLRDVGDVPSENRPDVALLVRDGYLSVFPDATLRPREPMSRARVLHTISRLLDARSLLQLQRGTARPSIDGALVLRSTKGKDQPIKVRPDAYLFRQIGEAVFPVGAVALVGGEPVVFHVNAGGEIDYLEVRPALNGASAERFSPFTNWSTELSLGQVQARLARAARGIGPITDLRVAARGTSRRVIDLEVVGMQGIGHVRGGRIRSVLGLREQLFVIDRKYGSDGRVTSFVFTGRGWGHGVGMCQVGAYGLAKQGLSYAQILKTYYSGIELSKLY
ncbi:MAG: SpoIID/LytB domain-containing protein [Pyrinomonadaceae bacterium]|nr:SpoIID/LytB domain-containing protein [Pyrinomonadaceae bacterium]